MTTSVIMTTADVQATAPLDCSNYLLCGICRQTCLCMHASTCIEGCAMGARTVLQYTRFVYLMTSCLVPSILVWRLIDVLVHVLGATLHDRCCGITAAQQIGRTMSSIGGLTGIHSSLS